MVTPRGHALDGSKLLLDVRGTGDADVFAVFPNDPGMLIAESVHPVDCNGELDAGGMPGGAYSN